MVTAKRTAKPTEKEKLIKYLKGIAKSLEALSKEIDKGGIDKESCSLMQKIGSDLLFKGTTQEFLK